MESLDLLSICVSAFIGVFVLLSLLALIMRFITFVFPQRDKKEDAALLAAISTVIHTIYPGTKITNVKEIK